MSPLVQSPRGNPLTFIYRLVALAFIIFAATVVVRFYWQEQQGGARPGAFLEDEQNTIEVFQKASPAVVFVHNLANKQVMRDFWTFDVTEVRQGTGSGFLWDKAGHIVTNFHVVQGADRVAVTLIDGKTYEAKIVGIEPRKDLAVLKIELLETNVQPFDQKVGDSARIVVGQKAIAIGNPYGLDHTLTVGGISAVGRSTNSVVEGVTIRDMIQTDAAINPGNSGGPLLDSQGRLIGMNTLILKNSTGIGFAVPSNTISRIVRQIIQHGKPTQAGIGISIFDERVSRSVSAKLGIQGMLVREVTPGSPADKAGLRGTSQDRWGSLVLGDIILAIDGVPVSSYDDIYNAFDVKKPGDPIVVRYYREGETREVTLQVVNVSD